MLNPKLGLSALLLEVGAWSGPLLQQHSDDALAAYLLLHAVASVLLTLFLLPLLPRERARPRIPLVVLIVACCYAVPIAGFLGVLAAALSLHYLGRTHSAEEYESVQLPEFDLHQHRQGNFRHAGLRSFLGNSDAPIQARMRAMVALQYVSGRTASPLLRSVLSDPSEDLRLLAYGMLDSLEKRINQAIDQELSALQAESADGGVPTDGAARLESLRRLSDLYWELVYQELVQGDLREHAIRESLRHCDAVLQAQPENAPLHMRRGRLLHALRRPQEAQESYEAASRLGLPATRVLPYQAQLCFERGDYAQARALVHALGPWDALPRLRPVIEYWNAP
jgi:tetratricopeptide (TPR) repeat protein